MKNKLFAVLTFALLFNHLQAAETPQVFVPDNCLLPTAIPTVSDPIDIKVVVSQKRIWLIADEMPMKCLKTKVVNATGKTVIEKCFTSKCAEWFLNIEALPKGEYTLYLGTEIVEKFKK